MSEKSVKKQMNFVYGPGPMTTKELYKRMGKELGENVLHRLVITAPNTGMELSFEDGKFTIINAGVKGQSTKRYTSFEKAIDYLLEHD